jgi:hypothetical protein
MEFKGTKGKWHIKENNATITDENENAILCWYGVATSTFWKNEVELKANSLLISKAPEMLEMLKNTASLLSILAERYSFQTRRIEEIEQLIKQATKI